MSQRQTQPNQSDARTFAWVNESLLDLTRNLQLTFYHESFRKWSLEVVSHTLILSTFSSFFFLLKNENTRWLFIEKIVIIACNQLNTQCNRLFQRNNLLYYHFKLLKCSSQHLENIQEQCNQLKLWMYVYMILMMPKKNQTMSKRNHFIVIIKKGENVNVCIHDFDDAKEESNKVASKDKHLLQD